MVPTRGNMEDQPDYQPPDLYDFIPATKPPPDERTEQRDSLGKQAEPTTDVEGIGRRRTCTTGCEMLSPSVSSLQIFTSCPRKMGSQSYTGEWRLTPSSNSFLNSFTSVLKLTYCRCRVNNCIGWLTPNLPGPSVQSCTWWFALNQRMPW